MCSHRMADGVPLVLHQSDPHSVSSLRAPGVTPLYDIMHDIGIAATV
jgi:hypothetical protein